MRRRPQKMGDRTQSRGRRPNSQTYLLYKLTSDDFDRRFPRTEPNRSRTGFHLVRNSLPPLRGKSVAQRPNEGGSAAHPERSAETTTDGGRPSHPTPAASVFQLQGGRRTRPSGGDHRKTCERSQNRGRKFNTQTEVLYKVAADSFGRRRSKTEPNRSRPGARPMAKEGVESLRNQYAARRPRSADPAFDARSRARDEDDRWVRVETHHGHEGELSHED